LIFVLIVSTIFTPLLYFVIKAALDFSSESVHSPLPVQAHGRSTPNIIERKTKSPYIQEAPQDQAPVSNFMHFLTIKG